uniref:TFIIS N-terminal domain-containing protein n=1 Tax=Ciona intestinalis TaxID=7719 RepID=F6WYC4_CIOIN
MGQPVDPLTLLKALSPMLDVTGAVIGGEEMQNIVKLMKDATKLVSRCVYLNILRVTESTEVLEQFLAYGGWSVMNAWLADAKSSENMALILEVMKLLQRLPLRIDHLKQNNTPKIVKSLSKSATCTKVKSTAANLMSTWLNIIRNASANPSNSKPKKETKVKPKLDKIPKKEKKEDKKVPVVRAPSFAKIRKTVGLRFFEEVIIYLLKPGLEPEMKKSQPKKINNKRSSIENDDNVPDKKFKTDPKHQKKILINSNIIHKNPFQSTIVTISAGFMDALNSVPTVVKRPVKRRPTKSPKTNSSNDKHSPSHTMSVSGEAIQSNSPLPPAADFGEPMDHDRTPSPVPSPTPSKPRMNKWGKPMKSVRWMDDSRLETIRYFECEEGERVNVTSQNFKDAMQRDRMSEREKLGDFHHKGDNSWKKPQLIDLPASLVEPGSNSIEKDIQKEREKTVLQEIFLSIEMVPDSPAEPDPEPYEMVPPKVIPIDDNTSIIKQL